ncbi:protein-tyrosine phosphatase family protein [Paenibacillus validus]|uniref:protein-tyrosine phosphatase family protein n=1 Tax=Paenibacillus validus TaxID=44253 RepID=UPI003D2B0241
MTKTYQALVEDRIFVGGAADVKDMITEAHCDMIVDLREEATEPAYTDGNVTWIHIPIGDNSEIPQEEQFDKAIMQVVTAYRNDQKVGFHCGGGKGRTGAVAIGTLIELGKARSIEEAEELAKSIRPVIHIRPPQREALEKLFEK